MQELKDWWSHILEAFLSRNLLVESQHNSLTCKKFENVTLNLEQIHRYMCNEAERSSIRIFGESEDDQILKIHKNAQTNFYLVMSRILSCSLLVK
jgi:hypothetical protein